MCPRYKSNHSRSEPLCWGVMISCIITARIRRMGEVMFSLCPHRGGAECQVNQLMRGGQVQPGLVRWVSWPGGGFSFLLANRGGQVQPVGGGGIQVNQPTGGGGVRSSWRGVRSSHWGGSVNGGVSILCPLVCTIRVLLQEDFLVIYVATDVNVSNPAGSSYVPHQQSHKILQSLISK